MRTFWKQFAMVLLVSAAGGALAAGSVVTVSQRGRAFSTAEVQVGPGQALQFNNDDAFVHQVYVAAPGFTFESDELQPGNTLQMAFPRAGSFTVLCRIHPKMRLAVVVR